MVFSMSFSVKILFVHSPWSSKPKSIAFHLLMTTRRVFADGKGQTVKPDFFTSGKEGYI